LFRAIQPVVFGHPGASMQPVAVNMWPVIIHFALVLLLGLSIPSVLAAWFEEVTLLITGSRLR
jgi:hydrogenase-4 component F